MKWVILVLSGGSVGFAGGYAGIGGAPILVAAMVLFAGYDQHLAQGTILAAMLGPMSLPGVWVMRDRVRLLWREAVIGVIAYAIFSNIGARLAYALQTRVLSIAFAIVIIGIGLYYLARGGKIVVSMSLNPDGPTLAPARLSFNLAAVAVLGALVGVAGGLFGIGAGVLMVPIFLSLFGLHKDDARALSLAILLPPVSLGAVIEYANHDGVNWEAAGVVFCLYFLTNFHGARVGRKHDSRLFLKLTGLLLMGLGVATLFVMTATPS
jgi:uncharacterized membrane protein YfcA